MAVGMVYEPFFLRHVTPVEHPERADRLTAIVDALRKAKLLDQLTKIDSEPASPDAIARVHEPAYVDLVRMACDNGFRFIGSSDTTICRESYDVARLAAGGVLAACDAVMTRRVTSAFCAVRPPGHHAETDRAGGYCLFNNVAIAADHLIRKHNLTRVAIVDWDVHHGNGTQQIFYDRNDVLYISLHEAPGFLYPGTGLPRETGTGAGEGFTLNVVLQPGGGDSEYQQAFTQHVLPKLDAFAPQFVLISAGFDAAAADRTADMNVTPDGFSWMTRALLDVANRHADGRIVSVLEGGYDLDPLRASAVAHVRTLLQAPQEM